MLGVQVRYYWSHLEPRKDVYDFSKIEKDLAVLQAHRKRLIISIPEKMFNVGPRVPHAVARVSATSAAFPGGRPRGRTRKLTASSVPTGRTHLYPLGARGSQAPGR